MNTTLCVASFFMALFGSPHCALMCGGVAGALGACPARGPAGAKRRAGGSLTFQTGRLTSYAAVGAAAGWLGDGVLTIGRVGPALLVLRVVAGAVLIVVGLTMAVGDTVFKHAATPAARTWQRLGGFILRRAATGPHRALVLGLFWGLMPCGFLYAAFGLALTSTNAAQGIAVMTAFGLGTLPGLLALGTASRLLVARARAPSVRHAAGLVLVCLGLVQTAAAFVPAGLWPNLALFACCQTDQH